MIFFLTIYWYVRVVPQSIKQFYPCFPLEPSWKRYHKLVTHALFLLFSVKYDSVLDQQSISGKIVSLILCVWKPCYVKSGHILLFCQKQTTTCKNRWLNFKQVMVFQFTNWVFVEDQLFRPGHHKHQMNLYFSHVARGRERGISLGYENPLLRLVLSYNTYINRSTKINIKV